LWCAPEPKPEPRNPLALTRYAKTPRLQKDPAPIPDLEKELVELCLEQVKVDEAQREVTVQPTFDYCSAVL